MEIEFADSQSLEDSLVPLFKELLTHFDDPEREGLLKTPQRMAKSFIELLKANEPKITVFSADGFDEMIIDRDIPFYTFCEHHVLPFFGTVTVGYIPKNEIIGLSKIARVVEYFAHRLNTQEYFTKNIAEYLQKMLKPKGIGVIVKARHLCKEMRGVKATGEMSTNYLLGNFRNQAVRAEFLT
jgi:GTP cyclohydrolase I